MLGCEWRRQRANRRGCMRTCHLEARCGARITACAATLDAEIGCSNTAKIREYSGQISVAIPFCLASMAARARVSCSVSPEMGAGSSPCGDNMRRWVATTFEAKPAPPWHPHKSYDCWPLAATGSRPVGCCISRVDRDEAPTRSLAGLPWQSHTSTGGTCRHAERPTNFLCRQDGRSCPVWEMHERLRVLAPRCMHAIRPSACGEPTRPRQVRGYRYLQTGTSRAAVTCGG